MKIFKFHASLPVCHGSELSPAGHVCLVWICFESTFDHCVPIVVNSYLLEPDGTTLVYTYGKTYGIPMVGNTSNLGNSNNDSSKVWSGIPIVDRACFQMWCISPCWNLLTVSHVDFAHLSKCGCPYPIDLNNPRVCSSGLGNVWSEFAIIVSSWKLAAWP